MAMIVMIIFLSVSSSNSVPTADKLKPSPNLTHENPSSSLLNAELTSVPSLPASQAELTLTSQLELHVPPSPVRALTSQPELQVQTLELHVPPSPVRALTSQPELQVQTLELHVPPSLVRASPPRPTIQSDTTSLSAHATQGGQESQENSMTAPTPANEIQTDTAGPSGHANPLPRFFPLYRRPLQSPIQRNPFQPSFLPITVPWYHRIAFMAGGQHPNEYHRMDRLSRCVLNYFLAGGLSYTSSWTERPSLSTSIYIQCFLNQVAFSLFLLAHFVFPRTNPPVAFIIDRVSFSLIVISGYLSTMPMYPPYVAIIMLLVVVMVYIFSRLRG